MTSRATNPSVVGSPDTDTVLIVDDQPANVALLTHALAGCGLRLITACNGREAMTQLENGAVDLILLDAMMPGMSGFEVAEQVRTRKRDELLPILMVTAVDAPVD